MFAELTWLRPAALLLLLPLPLLYAALQRGSVARNPWAAHIDAGLLPALWPRAAQRRGLWPPRPRALLGSALWLLATLALAGPSWRSLPVPTQQAGAQSVIAFGLSDSMRAADLSPDRLTRARIALDEWLALQQQRPVGLVAYAGSAYRVSPLTRDRETLSHMLHALRPDVMPTRGHNIAAALEEARGLFDDAAGGTQRRVLLLSDGPVDAAAMEAARALARAGIRLQVLSVGTTGGAPVPLDDGRFATDARGKLQLAAVDHEAHRALASAGAGDWQRAQGFDAQAWAAPAQTAGQGTPSGGEGEALAPVDEGYWLLLPLLLAAALAFRRGVLAAWVAALLPALLLASVVRSTPAWADAPDLPDIPTPDTAAAEPATAATMEVETKAAGPRLPAWLLNTPQRALRRWRDAPSLDRAAQIPDPAWRAAAALQSPPEDGADALAEEALTGQAGIEAEYNRALAQARQGKLDEAIAGFESVLEQDPEIGRARDNLALLRELREQQRQQQQQAGDGDSEGEPQQGEKEQQSGRGDSGEQQAGEDAAPQPGEQDAGESSSADAGEAPPQEPTPADSTAEAESAADGEPAEPSESAEEPDPAGAAAKAEAEATQAEAGSLTQAEEEEAERALRQWLRRVDSDPATLLRERFRQLEIERRQEAQR